MTVNELLQQAQGHHQAKEFEQAISCFEQAIAIEPNAIDIQFNTLVCLINANRYNQARERFKTVYELVKADAGAQFSEAEYQSVNEQLATIGLRLDLPSDCIELLQHFKQLSAQAKFTQIQALCLLEKWPSALAHCEALAEAQPQDGKVMNQLAICLVKMQKFADAIEVYKKLVTAVPNKSVLHIKFADLYLLAHQADKAREQLDIAISLRDHSLQRYELECKITRIENNKQPAILAAKLALKIKPSAEFAWQLIQDFGDLKDNQWCIQQLSTILDPLASKEPSASKSTSKPSYEMQLNAFTLAKALQKCERYPAAFSAFEKANSLQKQALEYDGKGYNASNLEAYYAQLASVNYLPSASTANESSRQFFVVGMPRSGTTLVNRVLSQQNGFDSCGESNAVATLFENMLSATNQSASSKGDVLAVSREDNQVAYRTYISALNPNIANNTVDKMPHNFRYVGAIVSTFNNTKVIQMRRSVTDLALSIFSQFFNAHHAYSVDLKDIAHAIFHANQLMDFWARSYPEHVIDIQYEELASNPSKEFQRLFDFCGLVWNEDYLNFHKEVVASFTFSETQVRKPINTQKVAFSRHYEEQLAVVVNTYQKLTCDYLPASH